MSLNFIKEAIEELKGSRDFETTSKIIGFLRCVISFLLSSQIEEILEALFNNEYNRTIIHTFVIKEFIETVIQLFSNDIDSWRLKEIESIMGFDNKLMKDKVI